MTEFNTRLTILSKKEIEDVYGLPQFNDEERAFYFSLDDDEKHIMGLLRSCEARVHFILQLGYIKAKDMFFENSFSECLDDTNYILKHYFPEQKINKDYASRNVRVNNYNRILKLLSYTFMNKDIKDTLRQRSLESTRISVDTRYLFDQIIAYLHEQSIVLPGYSTLQDIISYVLTHENKRLYALIAQHIPASVDAVFKELLTYDQTADEKNPAKQTKQSKKISKEAKEAKKIYGITVLKKDAKGFNYTEMMQEIYKKNRSADLFKNAKTIIPMLGISQQNVNYYASMVDYYSVDRLTELSYAAARLYMICYIYHRFERIHDNLIGMFFYRISIYGKQGKEYAKNAVYDHKRETSDYDEKIAAIIDVMIDEKIADQDVRSAAFNIVDKEQFSLLSKHLRNQLFDEIQFQWDYYLSIAKTITKNLRPLVRAIDFESDTPDNALMKAVDFIKDTFDKQKSLKQQKFELFPIDFIPDALQGYLYEAQEVDGTFQTVLNVYKYEFLVYYLLSRALNSERIFVNTSINFKSFNEDLYKDWDTNKDEILKELNNPVLNTPINEQLATFKKTYTESLVGVNQRVKSGENTSVRIKKTEAVIENGVIRTLYEWTLPYPKKEEEINSPFYDQIPPIGLSQMLRFVNEQCGLIDEFTHIKSRYAKTKADEASLYAVITAFATGHGIFQMAGLCDINYTQLLGTSRNFIRLENLKNANAKLVNKMSTLPHFNRCNLLDNKLIFSIDGKKVLTRRNHCMARHSSKYFGQKRGVVLLSMVANNACPNAILQSPHEYEGHSLFDVVFNNITDLEADCVSGDTHSINKVNFALMHLIGCAFIPHIKNIPDQANTLSSFESPDIDNDYLIVPQERFNEALILSEWSNIQHIFVSLLMKHTTQRVIVRKLSTHHRSNKTLRALWEYNKILHDQHVLNVIDSPPLRRGTRTTLNRGEGYHQLTGKIMSINGNKLRGTTELELAISSECIRLIANCIIFYNTYLLSELYALYEESGDKDVLEII